MIDTNNEKEYTHYTLWQCFYNSCHINPKDLKNKVFLVIAMKHIHIVLLVQLHYGR